MTQKYDETALAVPTTDILLEVLLETTIQEELIQPIKILTEKRIPNDDN